MCIYTKYIDIVVNIVIVTKVISGKYDFMWLCIAVDVAPCPYPDQSRGGCAWPPSLGFIGWATRLRRSSRGRRLLLVASAFTGGGSFQPGVSEPGNNKSKTGQIEPKTLWPPMMWGLPGKAPGGATLWPIGGGGWSCGSGCVPDVFGGGSGGVMFGVNWIK